MALKGKDLGCPPLDNFFVILSFAIAILRCCRQQPFIPHILFILLRDFSILHQSFFNRSIKVAFSCLGMDFVVSFFYFGF
jgi:hypothetical protein